MILYTKLKVGKFSTLTIFFLVLWLLLAKFNYPPANEVAKGYSNASFRPSVLRVSGTLLIFKVKGQGHRVKFLGEGIRHALRCPCFYSHFSKYFPLKFDPWQY